MFDIFWTDVLTQAMMDCLVSPPQPGDESYDTFIKVSVGLQFGEYFLIVYFSS